MKVKVILESKDKHQLEVIADVHDMQVLQRVIDGKVIDLGYDAHQYKIKIVVPMN
jgi:uncharacterized protein YajQ (UPF0234 family)